MVRIRKRRQGALVLNKGTSIGLERITTNFRPTYRYEDYEGRRHMVVPMVMLTEGVHSGSQGPLLYNNNEIGKTPAVWNHKPVVVYHPKVNGQDVSACDPDVLKTYKVGTIFNTKHAGNRLKAEAWIDVDKANQVDERVIQAVLNGQMMEVSTGLFSDFEDGAGDWNGEAYVGVVRNMRPDHLAILPDQKGACSIKDGAGLLRNNKPGEGKETDVDRKKLIDALISNEKTEWGEDDREFLTNVEDARFKKIIANGKKLIDDEGKKTPTTNEDDPVKVKKIVKKDDETPTLNTPASTPEPKKQQTVEEFIANAPPEIAQMIGHGLQAHAKVKDEIIARIVANANNKFTDDQLRKMDLGTLESIVALVPTTNTQQKVSQTYSGLADAFLAHQPVTVNVQGGASGSKVEPLEEITMSFESK